MRSARCRAVLYPAVFLIRRSETEQDISSKWPAATPELDLLLGMGEPANLMRAKKVGIDAGGSVARPESTIPIKSPLIEVEPQLKKRVKQMA